MECSHEKEWNNPVFGPQSVFVLSTDNKKDTTWNHSSNKANPMFMDMFLQLHQSTKFTPSVCAACAIKMESTYSDHQTYCTDPVHWTVNM